MVPASKSLEKILNISDKQSKEQKAYSDDGHGEKNFPDEVAWHLIPSQGTNLLTKQSKVGFISEKKVI